MVIVTTKNGKKGDVKVDFNTFFQFTSAAKKFEMLNADEYLNVHNMMYENAEAKKIGYLTFTDSDGRLKTQQVLIRTGRMKCFVAGCLKTIM